MMPPESRQQLLDLKASSEEMLVKIDAGAVVASGEREQLQALGQLIAHVLEFDAQKPADRT